MGQIQINSIIRGPFWQEDLRVKSIKTLNHNYCKIEAIGTKTSKYYNPILSPEDLNQIEIVKEDTISFSSNGERVFLFLEALRIRNAFQFDPLYAINVSQIDPLPHQIEAVYHHILKNPRIRFLLAHDPGAGKTIMAGLLIKELKYRGLAERILIVVPGHLKDQWLREMKEKFQENFTIINRSTIDSEWGKNVFNDKSQIIISMDFAKQDDVMFALKDSSWDLCIVDEAHKMSAYKYGEKISKTQRYDLGELLSSISNYLLFLTATPHKGDPENFRLLLDLLQPGLFANTELLSESIRNKDNPLFLKKLKEDLKDFNGTPLFPPRKVETVKYHLSDDEKILYNAVTEYVEKYFNKALEKDKRNVTFALTILQRRLASSVRAVRKSLERRFKRLKDLYEKGSINYVEDYDENFIEDLEEKERWKKEEQLLERLTSSETMEELKQEIDKLEELVLLAKKAEQKEIETKLNELKKVINIENIQGSDIKLLIFTESKDTLEYLVEKLKSWGFSVSYIHGGMNLDDRISAEADFRNHTQIMVSTEAGGEGINLQFCWLMVNYDIPWNPNRLEQRMGRIHRYGQQHEVHIYNLVAADTREGSILVKLFEKLSHIKEHLGSDRVFDVIGEILVGKNLKDLILDAIANRRTMDDILKDLEQIPDEEAIKKVKEITLEALATRHIDLTRILGEQRTAKENKLVPEYVEHFFEKAAAMFNIKMEKRGDGIWKISNIPSEIRNQPNKFKLKYGEIHKEYSRISFDKVRAIKSQAEFIAMGHPLLEGVIEIIIKNFEQDARDGAVFIDPEGKIDGLIWFLDAEIRDGKNEIAGKKLFAVYQNMESKLSFINPAIIWDLKPEIKKLEFSPQEIALNDSILTFTVTEGLENYKKELLQNRLKVAEIKKKYGIRSLDSNISISVTKLTDYETKKIRGENIPEVNIQNETRKKQDLIQKKEKLEKEIEAETHLYFTEPRIVGVIRVVPQKLEPQIASDEEIEKIGMDIAMEFERNNGRIPEDVSSQNLGYDIRSYDNQVNYRYIEVKARSQEGVLVLTPNEWLMAQRLKDEYWIYVVINAGSKPKLFLIQNPAEKLESKKEINIVRYIISDWKINAKEAN